jgi:hypothetical protein
LATAAIPYPDGLLRYPDLERVSVARTPQTSLAR